jgi:hypothetical protein
MKQHRTIDCPATSMKQAPQQHPRSRRADQVVDAAALHETKRRLPAIPWPEVFLMSIPDPCVPQSTFQNDVDSTK